MPRDRDPLFELLRIMGANLRADAVLEWGDDLPACGVVFGVCREHEQHIERKSHRIAFYLDVPFLKNIEKTDLDLPGEIRKFA